MKKQKRLTKRERAQQRGNLKLLEDVGVQLREDPAARASMLEHWEDFARDEGIDPAIAEKLVQMLEMPPART